MAIDLAAEVLRLRSALRDLVALSTIPAAWVGREPPAIPAGLADVLVGSLHLDFAFVRLRDPSGSASVEAARGNAWKAFPEWLERRGTVGELLRKEIIPDVGGDAGPCRGIVIPVGVDAEGGLVAAACDRTDFPTEIDELILSIAANHAATAFQSAHLIDNRRWAEEALRKSEQELRQSRDELEMKVAEQTAQLRRTVSEAFAVHQRFADVVNSVDGIVWEADAETFEFSFVSEQAQRILGYPTERWLNDPAFWKDHLHPEDRDRAIDFCVNATAGKRNHDFEYRMIAADGRSVWMRDIVTVVVEGDRATKLRGLMLDITEYKQAEEVLQEKANLLDLTHDSVFVRNMNDVITYWNRGAEKLYGWKKEEAIGRVSHELTKTIFPQPLEAIMVTLLGSGGWEGGLIQMKRDGTHVVVASRWSLQRDGQGTPVAILETNNDVTEWKRAEEDLRLSEQRFRYLADHMEEVFWFIEVDPERMLYVSPSFETVWGRPVKDLYENPRLWLQCIHPEDQPRVQGAFDAWLTGRAEWYDIEYRIVTPRHEIRWIYDRGVREVQKDRQVFVCGIATDITERKRAEALLAGEKRTLEMVAKGDSLAQILDNLCRLVEEQASGALASILLVDADRLWHGGAPSLPTRYTDSIDGAAIGPSAGSCGTAAYRREQVIVEDIATDTLWADYRKLALPHSLRACWSTPVFSSQGNVIATFAMYYREPRRPNSREQDIIEQITHLAGIAIERKLTEEKLARSERNLAEAQRLTHTGSFVWDIRTKQALHLSDEWYRIYEFDPDKDKDAWDGRLKRIHPDDVGKWQAEVDRATHEKSDYDLEYRLLFPHGVTKYVHGIGHPVLNSSGEVVQFMGSVTDVTERKRVEHRLIIQHQVTQILAEATSLHDAAPQILRAICESLIWDVAALWTVDKQAGLLRCMEVWHRPSIDVPQFEAETRAATFVRGIALPGRVWFSGEPIYIPDVVHDASFLRAPIAAREFLHATFGFPILLSCEVLGVMEFFSHEIRQPDQDLLDTMATIGSQIGQFIERKRAEESAHKTQLELAHVARVATLGELTASIAHEINQPLGAIVNNAGACLRWLAAQNMEEARRSVEHIIRDGHRASEIISRIRALAKKTPLQKDWLDLNDVIREVLELTRGERDAHRVAVQTQLSDDVPPMLGDRIQLQQVLLNVIMNAIEAMGGAGEGPRRLVIGSNKHDAQHIVVTVQDSGPGIDPAHLDHLFEAFYSTKPRGLGMGLAVSRSIIDSHGGRLWATANEPRGATFQFTLPVGGNRLV